MLDKVSDLKKRGEIYQSFLDDAKGPLQQLKINHAYLLSLSKTSDAKKPLDPPQLESLNLSVIQTAEKIISSIDQKELLATMGEYAKSRHAAHVAKNQLINLKSLLKKIANSFVTVYDFVGIGRLLSLYLKYSAVRFCKHC